MSARKSDPKAIVFSILIYRILLITYPKDFQREYAASMAQVFRDCCLRAFHTQGLPGMFSLWGRTLVDYIQSAFEEYSRKGVLMNNLRFVRLSGMALILGTAMYLSSVLVELVISGHGLANDPGNYYSRPIDQVLSILPYVLLPGSMILLIIGIMGLYVSYGSRATLLGKVGLVVATAGGSLAFVMCLTYYSSWLNIFMLSNQVSCGLWPCDMDMLALILLFGGLFTFGIDAVQRRLLSRWSFIPIVAGVLFPVRILLGYLQEATTPDVWVRWSVDLTMMNIPVLIITSFGLITLGYLLLSGATLKERLVPA